MTNTSTPKPQLSMTKDAIRKRIKRSSARQAKLVKLFRENPDKLATEVIAQILADKHANENPESYKNGAMHWYQHNWGSFSPERTELIHLHQTLNGKNVFAPQCASTGCVFGWATTLAGYPMVYQTWATLQQVVTHDYDGEFIEVNDCWDAELQQTVTIEDRGQDLFRLSNDQSQWLFNGYRTQEQVLWALREIEQGNYDWDYDDGPADAAPIRDDDEY